MISKDDVIKLFEDNTDADIIKKYTKREMCEIYSVLYDDNSSFNASKGDITGSIRQYILFLKRNNTLKKLVVSSPKLL